MCSAINWFEYDHYLGGLLVMSSELSNTDKRRAFVEALQKLKVEIIRPVINKCYVVFQAEKNNIINALTGV